MSQPSDKKPSIDDLVADVKRLDITETPARRTSPRKPASAPATSIKSRPEVALIKPPWTKHDLKTGIIYDDFMAKHECPWTKGDECPERYLKVMERLRHYKLIEHCVELKSKFASEEQVLLAHDKDYYELVKSTKGVTDLDKLKSISEKFDGIYFNEHTYDCAMLALGSCLELTDAVLDGKVRNGFAIVRTPGHHAQQSEANGFCYFNNAAIAARHCVQNRGLKRVLIIDWDVHHGQGTQSFFYDDPSVMYVSIHRYERGRYWPELIESNFNFTGAGKGKGYNLNLPLNEIDCNDADFLLMWFNVIMPVAYEFDPELVIISAGFDAAIGCPEGKMRVKPVTYHVLCHSLMSLADGKCVSLLEGGYNLVSLAESAAMTLRALIGLPCGQLDPDIVELDKPHVSVVQTILDVIWAVRPQWKFLQMQGSFDRFASHNDDDDEQQQQQQSAGGDSYERPRYKPVSIYEGPSAADSKPDKYDLVAVACPKDEARQQRLSAEIDSMIARTDLRVAEHALGSKRTLLVLDDAMTLHQADVGFPGMNMTEHPEKPARYTRIKRRLEDTGLFERCALGKSRRATDEDLLAAHSKEHIERMRSTQRMSPKQLQSFADSMDSVYFHPSTFDCALLAAGCALEAVDRVLDGSHANAFALIRPPGHHAMRDAAAGFCFFNNVVVAARHALKHHSNVCKRVLIVDYDFHHGNGVQRLVQDEPNILYVSLHGYNDGHEYPMEVISNYRTNAKNIVNVPWNHDRMGDTEYILAYLNVVLPCAYEFAPDLVLVSSGFDAAVHDPIGRYKLSPHTYGHLVHHLLPLAKGRLVACLEGGYNLDSISEAAAHVVAVLLGDPPQSMHALRPPFKSAVRTLRDVVGYQKSHYKLLCLDYDLPTDQVD